MKAKKNFNKAMIFLSHPPRERKNKHRMLHVKFRKTFLIHTHMALFGIRFGQVNATSLFFGVLFGLRPNQCNSYVETLFFQICTRNEKKNKTATTTGHSADCRRNRCINRHKIIQFLRMGFNRVFAFVCCLKLFQSTLIHRNQRQK